MVVRMLRDDASGELTTPPGIETERRIYAATSDWDGGDLPAHPDAPPLEELMDPAQASQERERNAFRERFQLDML